MYWAVFAGDSLKVIVLVICLYFILGSLPHFLLLCGNEYDSSREAPELMGSVKKVSFSEKCQFDWPVTGSIISHSH